MLTSSIGDMDIDLVFKMLKKAQEDKYKLLLELEAVDMKISLLEREKVKINNSHFKDFISQRIRLDKTSDEKTSVSDLWRAYRYWTELTGSNKYSQIEFIKCIQDRFGNPHEGKWFTGLFVFNTQEDVDCYDEQSQQKVV